MTSSLRGLSLSLWNHDFYYIFSRTYTRQRSTSADTTAPSCSLNRFFGGTEPSFALSRNTIIVFRKRMFWRGKITAPSYQFHQLRFAEERYGPAASNHARPVLIRCSVSEHLVVPRRLESSLKALLDLLVGSPNGEASSSSARDKVPGQV
jgi:hypothetical protein